MTELNGRVAQAIARLRELPEPDAQALQRLHVALRAETMHTDEARAATASAGTGWSSRLFGVRAPSHVAHRHEPGWLVLSRAQAVAWALLLVLGTSGLWFAGTRHQSVTSARDARIPVQFVFIAESAREIALVGDFNDWDASATRLSRGPGGVWSAVVPLQPGRFAYSFIVDGQSWHADPEAPVVTNDFGRPSSVLYVERTERM